MVYLVSIGTSKYSSYDDDDDDDDLFLWYGWPPKGFEPARNLSSSFVEWSGAVRITTTPRHHKILSYIPKSEVIYYTKNTRHQSWKHIVFRWTQNWLPECCFRLCEIFEGWCQRKRFCIYLNTFWRPF